jgi:hypothetical protein
VHRADNLTTIMCRLSWNLGTSTSWKPQGLPKVLQRLLYRYHFSNRLLGHLSFSFITNIMSTVYFFFLPHAFTQLIIRPYYFGLKFYLFGLTIIITTIVVSTSILTKVIWMSVLSSLLNTACNTAFPLVNEVSHNQNILNVWRWIFKKQARAKTHTHRYTHWRVN